MKLRLARNMAFAAVLTAGLAATAPEPASAQDTILLGAAVSETGKYATNGMHTMNGYNLAVERINEMGGVTVGDTTYMLEIKYYDDESEAARAAELAERLVNQDDIQFILGPYGSPLTAAMAPITEKYGVPMVEGNGASRSIFTKGYRYVFAVLSTSDQYLSSAVDLAAEKAQEEGRDPATLRLALAMGDPGSEIQAPMAIVILYGLITSTVLNMLVVPAMLLRFGSIARTSSRPLAPQPTSSS